MLLLGIKHFFFRGGQRSVTLQKNIYGSIVFRGVSILVSLALVPLTINYVSAELYGVWLTLSSILLWLGFLDIGFSQGLKNKLGEAIAKEDWVKGRTLVSTTYLIMVAIFTPVSVVLGLAAPYIDWSALLNISSNYSYEIAITMQVLVFCISMQLVINVIVSVLSALQKVALANSYSVIGNVLSLGVIYVMTKTCAPSLLLLSLAYALIPVMVTFISSLWLYNTTLKQVSPQWRYVNFSSISEIFGLGYKFFIINFQVVILYQSTNFLISFISSPTEVTSYNIAYKYLSVAMMLYTIISAPLWPAYTEAYVKEDYTWMNNMRKKMLQLFFISVVACLLMVLFAKPVYRIWVGNEVEVPFMMTFLVALYVIMYGWSQLNGTMIAGIGKLKISVVLAFVGMILHVPLSFMLSKQIGCYGVLVSLIALNALYSITYHIQVQKLLSRNAVGIWNQ